jgi:hypothetical protein
MKNIVIIHPEGNVTNNPSLSSIVLLLKNYYIINIVQQKNIAIKQDLDWDNVFTIFIDNFDEKNLFNKYMQSNLFPLDISLVIGVDQGIKLANYISVSKGIPLGYINYEMYFKNEWNSALKYEEINACKNINFAITQDSFRAYLLSKENSIPINRIINIPIGEQYLGPYKQNNYLRNKLNIPYDKKIALYMGSFGDWTATGNLIKCVAKWPESWVLVLHPRYGLENNVMCYFDDIKKSENIFVSYEPVHYTYELENIVCSADIGIVLYLPDFSSPIFGKNILFIGLSSGKLSTYLKYGLPVIVNNKTNLADLIYDYQLGYVVQDEVDVNPCYFTENNLPIYKERCINFFKEYLDFSKYKNNILYLVENVICGKNILNIIENNNRIINLDTLNSQRMNDVYNILRNNFNSLKIKYNSTIEKKMKIMVRNFLSRFK